MYDPQGCSSTINAVGGGLGAKTGLYMIPYKGEYYDGFKVRRLTPKECERLQGFPDDWTEGLSDTQRYKCVGNAISVPIVKLIAERIKKEKQYEN